MLVGMRRPNTNAREEGAVRSALLWFLGTSIVLIVLPYLFCVPYQWR